MSALNRAIRGAMCLLLAATLVGWGNSEADQRKALIAFLQDLNNRAGAHVLVPNANDEKAFGPYLQHYAIILDFNKDMNGSVQDFIAQAIKLGFGPNPAPRSIEQMAAAPADLTTAKDVIDKMEQGVETRLAKANTERGALKQPDDLKAVYDKTFDRLVAAPAVAFENSAKALGSGIDAALALVTLHQRAPRQARRPRHADPSEGPAHLGRAAAADEGLPGRRRAFRRRAAAKRSGTGRV